MPVAWTGKTNDSYYDHWATTAHKVSEGKCPRGKPRPWWEQIGKYVTVGAKTIERNLAGALGKMEMEAACFLDNPDKFGDVKGWRERSDDMGINRGDCKYMDGVGDILARWIVYKQLETVVRYNNIFVYISVRF